MNNSLHTHCILCGAASLSLLPRYNQFPLVKCARCSFVFSQKNPTQEELIGHYDRYGRNDYLSPITVKRFHEILDALEKYRKTNNMIDVGCGIGYFLEVAKERGWNVYGTEFTEEAVQICRAKGITMHEGKLDVKNYEPSSFDVIISIEVLEHLNRPQEEVQNFHSLLRNGGCVYLTTPNFNSLSRKILGVRWSVLAYPEHLCYYTPRTITELFRQQNFIAEKIWTTGISITRIRSSISASHESGVSSGSDDEKLRYTLESNLIARLIKSAINGSFTLTGMGDNLKATFINQ